MQVDTLNAAGAAAKIPSRIGKEQEAILGSVHPNGTTLSSAELAAAAAAAEADPSSSEKDVTEDGYDVEHERYYGPRRTAALVFLLLLVVGAIWAILRWRTRRRQERYRRLKGKGRSMRLDERGGSSASAGGGRGSDSEGRWSGAYRDRGTDPIPYEAPETVAVFDVGAESDEEEEDSEGENSFEKGDDEERWGDMGRSEAADRWRGDGV